MVSLKKIFFKYLLIILLLIFLIHTTFIIAQQSIRKIIESDRLFLFLMKNTMLNLEKLADWEPTPEEKIKLSESLEKIQKNWKLDNDP